MAVSQRGEEEEEEELSHFHWVFPPIQPSSCCKYGGFRVLISGKHSLKCEPDKKRQERPLINTRKRDPAICSVRAGGGVRGCPLLSTLTSLT